MAKIDWSNVDYFFSKVAGTQYPNYDGSSRLDELRDCWIPEPLILRPEPDNPVDKDAVAVFRGNGKQIGYLTQMACGQVSSELSKGYVYYCYAKNLTGDYTQPGLNIVLISAKPGTPMAAVENLLNELPHDEFDPYGTRWKTKAPKANVAAKTAVGCGVMLVVLFILGLLIPTANHSGKPESEETSEALQLPAAPPPEAKLETQEESRSTTLPVTTTLSEGLSYEEVAEILGTEGRPAGKVGERKRYTFTKPSGEVIETTFEDDLLVAWERR